MIYLTEGYRNPTYLVEGAEVIIPFKHEGKMFGLKCQVAIACGDAGKVVNDKYGINKWVKLEDMAVEKNHLLARSPSVIAIEEA